MLAKKKIFLATWKINVISVKPSQCVKLICPQVSLASSILLISVMASNRYPQEHTVSPILAYANEEFAAMVTCYVLS